MTCRILPWSHRNDAAACPQTLIIIFRSIFCEMGESPGIFDCRLLQLSDGACDMIGCLRGRNAAWPTGDDP